MSETETVLREMLMGKTVRVTALETALRELVEAGNNTLLSIDHLNDTRPDVNMQHYIIALNSLYVRAGEEKYALTRAEAVLKERS